MDRKVAKKLIRKKLYEKNPATETFRELVELYDEVERVEKLQPLKGEKGDSVVGERGERGEKGEKGDTIKGEKGDSGEKGERGEPGESIKGEPGKDGRDGSSDTPEQIVDKLNTLKDVLEYKVLKGTPTIKEMVEAMKKLPVDERLDISDIRNWNQPARGKLDQRWHGGGGASFGTASIVPYEVVIGASSGQSLAQVSGLGTSGQVLTSMGNSSAPSWQNAVSSFNGLAGNVVLAAGSNITLNPSENTITISSSVPSYTFSDSLVNTSGTVTLVGDASSPGDSYYYGTNGSGTKGFYTLPSGSGIAIGDPVTSGTANSILYIDASGNLAQDNAKLNWNDGGTALTVEGNIYMGYPDAQGISAGAKVTKIGDWANQNNDTQLIVDDNAQTISDNGIYDAGLYINQSDGVSQLGDWNSNGYGTYIYIYDPSQTIELNASNAGLGAYGYNGMTLMGDWQDNNNGNIVKVDDDNNLVTIGASVSTFVFNNEFDSGTGLLQIGAGQDSNGGSNGLELGGGKFIQLDDDASNNYTQIAVQQAQATNGNGTSLSILGANGNGSGSSSSGGPILLTAGAGWYSPNYYNGASIVLGGGGNSAIGHGGSLTFTAGSSLGSAAGGAFSFQAGAGGSTAGNGGGYTFAAGNATGGNNNGGNFQIFLGTHHGSGSNGTFSIRDGNGNTATILTSSLTGNQSYTLPVGGGTFITTSNLSSITSTGELSGITTSGKITIYNGITTTGQGVAVVAGAGLNVSLNTTSTAVTSYTPTSATGQMFIVSWNLSCATTSTPTLTLTYTDPKAGAQTITLYNTAMTGNTVASGTFPLVATSAANVSIAGSDATALGDIFASATIEVVQ